MMNRLYFILIGLILYSAGNIISAQTNGNDEKRTLEREIKTSGSYLYGEAVGKDKQEATKLAKSMLISEINRESVNHPEWQFAKTIKADDIQYAADMIDLARGNKVRVIAYLKKDNIQAIFSNNAPKIQLSDKKGNKQNDKIQDTSVKVVTEKTGKTKELLANESVSEQSELLKSIISTTSASEINKILRANKMKGKVAYGGINTLTDASKAYILVYTDDKIIAILDKGGGTERKDLISGENKNVADLYKDKGNMRIWFQLF
jgi:hypothetical protein